MRQFYSYLFLTSRSYLLEKVPLRRRFSVMPRCLSLLLAFIMINVSAHAQQPGSLDASFNAADLGNGNGNGASAQVYAISFQSNSKIIIGGAFSTYNGTSRNDIARLNADGTLDTSFDPGTGTNGHVRAIALQPDGKLIIGGQFTSYNGTSCNNIARLNADGSIDNTLSQGTGTNDIIYAITLQPDGKIILGGSFTTYNGTARNTIVRLNSNGTLDATFTPGTGANGAIRTTALQADGKVLIGGEFTSFNGTTRQYIARLNANGTLDTGFNLSGIGTNYYVYTISTQSDNKIIIGGQFSTYNGTTRNSLARLNADGSLDSSFNPGAGIASGTGQTSFGIWKTIVLSDGKILIGGQFVTYDGAARNSIARLNSNGTLDTGFTPGTGTGTDNGSLISTLVLQPDGKVLIGGNLNVYDNLRRGKITRINANGTNDAAFNPGTGLNDIAQRVALLSNGKIIIAGQFSSYNGTFLNRVARLNADGSLDNTFVCGLGNGVGHFRALAIQPDGKIIVGGNLTYFNGSSQYGTSSPNIFRLNADGSIDGSFNIGSGANGTVNSIVLQTDGKILVAGQFSQFNGVAKPTIVRLNTDGSLDAGFNPGTGATSYINTVALQADGKILIGGAFGAYNGIVRNGVARLLSNGSLDTGFSPGTGATDGSGSNVGEVTGILVQGDGKVVIGGYFNYYNGTARNRVARLNANGSLDTSFTPGTGANNTVEAIAWQSNGKIIIGGNFTTYNGTSRGRIARLNNNGTLDPTFDPGTNGSPGTNYALAVQPDEKVIITGNFTSYSGTGRNRIARVMGGSVSVGPTDISLTATTVDENVADNSLVATINSAGAEAGETHTYSLVAGTGSTDNASFTISGNALEIINSPDFEVKNSYSIRIQVMGKGGLFFEKAFTITVVNENETPLDMTLSADFVNENIAANATVGTFATTDTDAGNTFTYSLVNGTGDADNTAFSILGNALRFTASPDFETKSSYGVRIRTTDQGGLFYEQDFIITVMDVNDAPVSLVFSDTLVYENRGANTAINNFSTTDQDPWDTHTYSLVAGAGDAHNAAFTLDAYGGLYINADPDFEAQSIYTIRVRTTDPGGLSFEKAFTFTVIDVNEAPTSLQLSAALVDENVAANTVIGTFSTTDPDNGDTQSYSLETGAGDADNGAFILTPGGHLSINHTPDFEDRSSYSILVRIIDQNNLFFDQAFNITINDLNETPVNLALAVTSVTENVAANSIVGNFSTTDPDTANTFTYSLVSGTGDSDNAAFSISGDSLRIAASPDFEAKSSYSIRLRTTDQDGLFFEQDFVITVNDLNETPINLALSATTVNENVAANNAVGILSTTDPDSANTFTYTLVTGTGDADNAAFTVTGNSLLINNSPDFETKNNYSVRLRTTDQGGLSFEKALTITVIDLNEAPTDLGLSANAVNENVPANTIIGTFSATDPDAGNAHAYTLVAGTGSADNAAFIISGNILQITSSPDFETKSSYSIRVRTTDQDGLSFERAFTVSVNDVNETSVVLSASSVNENVAANATIGTLGTLGTGSGSSFIYSLVTGTGSTDNATFTISGNSLRIKISPNFEVKNSYSVRIRATGGGTFFEQPFTVAVNDVNETPTNVALSATTLNENIPANAFAGTLSSVDPDAGNTFTYSLVSGTGSTDNAAFIIAGDSLRIAASPNFEAKNSYSIRIRTTDQGGLFIEKALVITIKNVNETPVNLALSATAVNENVLTNTTIGTFTTTDPDAGNTFTYSLVTGTGSTDNAAFNINGTSLRITASPNFEVKNNYSIRIRSTDQGGLYFEKDFTISVIDLSEKPANLELSATVVNENVAANTLIGTFNAMDQDSATTLTYALVSGTGSTNNASFTLIGDSLRLISSPNFEIRKIYSIRVRTMDQGGLYLDKVFVITVNDLNETPTNLVLSASLVAENVAANTFIGKLITSDVDAGSSFTYSLVAGLDTITNTAFKISGDSLRITVSPDFEVKSSYSLRIRTTDQGGLYFEKAFIITVTNVNEVPVNLALSATSVNENVAANTTVGTLTSTDPDAGSTFTYSLVTGIGNTDNAAFNIYGAALRITNSPNYEAKNRYCVRIRTTDKGGLFTEKVFVITINNLNEKPTNLELSATSVNENVLANTLIGTFSAMDQDSANTLTYALVSGTGSTNNASFTLNGDSLRLISSPNFEIRKIYSIRVRTMDQGGLYLDKVFVITVNDLNETPTNLVLSASLVAENVAANTFIGKLITSDVDAGSSFTYSLVAGLDTITNTAFKISGDSLRITVSPDFEVKSSYSLRIRTTDQGGLYFEKAFIITVTNVNEVPVNLALSATSVNENVAANTTVGTLTSTDPDAGSTFTYSLVSGTGSTDNAAFNIYGAAMRIIASPDFEAKNRYCVRIRTTDKGGLFTEKAFVITINDLNERPINLELSASSVNENIPANTSIGTFSATDQDSANTFTYSLVTGTGSTDNAAFNISGNSLRFSVSPDFEAKSNYSIRIRTTDQGGLFFEKVLVITVLDINEAPTNLALSATVVNENVAANTTVGTLTSTDPDAGNTFTYTLVGGAGSTDNAAFNISGNALRIANSPDFETLYSYSVRIRTTDQGGLFFEKAVVITVNNVNEKPVSLTLSAVTVSENVAANTTAGTLATTDLDAGNTFTYSLVSGTGSTDNAAFNISGNSLRITASPDFEAREIYKIRIRTSDQGGLFFEKALTIIVTDINEKPVDLALSADTVSENVAAYTTIGTFSTTDQDADNTFAYSLVYGNGSTDNTAFHISGDSLIINQSPDFEAKSSYSIRVRTTDQEGLFFEKAYIITINDVNENNSLAINNPTGTKEETGITDMQLLVYPNPSNGTFNLELGNTHKAELMVTDLSGKTIMQKIITSMGGKVKEALELKAAKGIYLLRINADGNLITRKLIVE
jgi:uncharacterized delta-60 repeat protein